MMRNLEKAEEVMAEKCDTSYRLLTEDTFLKPTMREESYYMHGCTRPPIYYISQECPIREILCTPSGNFT